MNGKDDVQDGSQKKLIDAFADRGKFVAYRSSAVFPVLLAPGTDTIIAMLNYWKIKSGMSDVLCNLRVYQENGRLVNLNCQKVVTDHFKISLKKMVAQDNFLGMVEIEIISTENMRFPFPAIIAFYKSGDAYSAVHSAGRVRNTDEAFIPSLSCETNWSCKFSNDTTPFFHVFNGPRQDSIREIRVQLFDPKNKLIEENIFCPEIGAPFSSKIFLANTVFKTKNIPDKSFIKVTLPNAEIFPRMVVGNYHKSIQFLEATHSFKEIDFKDYCPDQRPEKTLFSFMSILQPESLDAELASFPTNSPSYSPVTAKIRRAEIDVLEPTQKSLSWDASIKAKGIFSYRVQPLDRAISLDFHEGQTPSRLNASYRYRVKNSSGIFSTDIASGAESNVYPPKHSHWGHGVIGGKYETIVMFQNFSHNPSTTQTANGRLTIYSDKFDPLSCDLVIKPEGVRFVYLKRSFGLLATIEEEDIISWFVKFDAPTVYSYWVSYTNDGKICGDHGF